MNKINIEHNCAPLSCRGFLIYIFLVAASIYLWTCGEMPQLDYQGESDIWFSYLLNTLLILLNIGVTLVLLLFPILIIRGFRGKKWAARAPVIPYAISTITIGIFFGFGLSFKSAIANSILYFGFMLIEHWAITKIINRRNSRKSRHLRTLEI